MKRNKYLLLFLFIAVSSCGVNPMTPGENEDFYYIRNEGIDMPVWIKGNAQSDTYIIFVNGGPGDHSASVYNLPFHRELMKHYRMIYFDQRSAGWTIGNPANETLNPETMARDMDMVIDSVRIKYNPNNIFMIGHSWGGLLGTVYLTNATRQAKIRGWIELDGGHNWPLGMRLSVQFVTNHAQAIIDDPATSDKERSDWQKEIDWYQANPVDVWTTTFGQDWLHHQANVVAFHGYVSEENVESFDRINAEANADYNAHIAMRIHPYWRWFSTNPPIWEFDASVHMNRIILPSLILWGLNDGILPYQLATNAYALLGTPASNKSVVYFTNSAHFANVEEVDQCLQVVTNFIEQYR